MEECLERLKISKADDPTGKAVMDKIQQEYENSIQHKSDVPPYGIKDVSKVCPYPIEYGGKVKSGICKEQIERKRAK